MSDYSRTFRRFPEDQIRFRRQNFVDRPADEQHQELERLFEAAEKGTTRGMLIPALRNDADPNTRDVNTSDTPLILATINRHFENVWSLLEYGANPLTESRAVVRDHQFMSKMDEGFSPMPGDIPLTPPLIAVVLGEHQIVRIYTLAQTIIRREWHDEFRFFAAKADLALESRHNVLMKDRQVRIGFIPRNMPAVNRLLALTPA